MPRVIYALLIGIDDYPAPVPKLRGCVNDIRHLEQFLHSRIDPAGRPLHDALKLKTLTNHDAARAAVIDAFRTHLGQAGPGDVALFAYSGHGSQEQAPEQFWHLEPDHLNETLVCYDSRSAGSWDLADKELAQLIGAVSARGAHVVVLLDCCHSGSGTWVADLAETAVRRAPTDLRRRPLESYLVTSDEAAAGTARDLAARPSGWDIARRHVLLAACRDDEEAKEYQAGGISRGAFSYFLGETLSTIGPEITYRELFARTAALVRGRVQRQSPQLEATVADDLRQLFLGGALRPRPAWFLANHSAEGWSIDAGRLHGIPDPTPEDAARVALFDDKTSDNDLKDLGKAVCQARVTRVRPTSSSIEIEGNVDPARAPLKAVLSHLPTPPLKVWLDGEPAGIAKVREALAKVGPDSRPSLYVRESTAEEADYRVLARNNQYLILGPGDDRPRVAAIDGYTDLSAASVVARLEHIERWKTTAALTNPNISIRDDELQVEILAGGQAVAGSQVRLEYTREGGEWVNPSLRIRLKNTGKRTLFVGLLDLPETFGIFPLLNNVGCQKLEPGQETFADDGEPLPAAVPDELWEKGVGEIKDVVKVIICTNEFDARDLKQDDLPAHLTLRDIEEMKGVSQTRSGTEPEGTLGRLLQRVRTRQLGPSAAKRIDDWRTLERTFTTVRPLPAQPLTPGRGVTLTDGVKVEPHPVLTAAEVRLDSLPLALRSIGAAAPLPRWLYDNPAVVQPFEFSTTRALGGTLNVLELRGVNDPALVTEANPLVVKVPRPLGAGESVLPVASDGEFYLPLGRAEPVDGQTQVILERLPRPSEEGTRSLGGALRIFFQKVANRFFGTGYDYPILAVAEIDREFNAHYEPDPAQVKTRVAGAERIALFVHGIIGETRDMAASLHRAGVADRYDLILTFDYENLNEPISNTARALEQRLEQVGLVPGSGKQLDVVAHSMGGLVSRWFVEREGGNRLVRRLVMLGTPNGGSPWPGVVDWATTALAVGLNELSKVAWPASVLAGLVQATRWVKVSLDEMKPGSPFLQSLYGSPDPKVPCFLIAGNTSLIRAGGGDGERQARLTRLLQRVWSEQSRFDLANLFFSGADNDIAVSQDSMRYLADGREPACVVQAVACDHLSYFRADAGLKSLAEAVRAV